MGDVQLGPSTHACKQHREKQGTQCFERLRKGRCGRWGQRMAWAEGRHAGHVVIHSRARAFVALPAMGGPGGAVPDSAAAEGPQSSSSFSGHGMCRKLTRPSLDLERLASARPAQGQNAFSPASRPGSDQKVPPMQAAPPTQLGLLLPSVPTHLPLTGRQPGCFLSIEADTTLSPAPEPAWWTWALPGLGSSSELAQWLPASGLREH